MCPSKAHLVPSCEVPIVRAVHRRGSPCTAPCSSMLLRYVHQEGGRHRRTAGVERFLTIAVNGCRRVTAGGQAGGNSPFAAGFEQASTARAFRCRPRSLARRNGVSPNRDLNAASSIAANAVISGVTRSPRGVNASSVASRENFAFHGHTSWEVWRSNHFAIALTT